MSAGSSAVREGRSAHMRRAVARKLALQAIYRWQINTGPWQDLVQEFGSADDMPKADRAYFEALVSGIARDPVALDEELAPFIDRPPDQLDPVEHALLWIGIFELKHSLDVPYKVVISEAVSLTRRFGATDGHKFVNAVLDRAAGALRVHDF